VQKREEVKSVQPKIVQTQNTDVIPFIVYRHLSSLNIAQQRAICIKGMFASLSKLLNDNFEKYQFDTKAIKSLTDSGINEDEFHRILHKLNEKTPDQKAKGIYNTPNDVVDFIIANCISKKTETTYHGTKCLNNISELDEFLKTSIFDPTVGSGEFLVHGFQVKVNHLQTFPGEYTDKMYLDILSSLYGNDIDVLAIEICKVRLFFEVEKYISPNSYKKAVDILNENLTNYDFINLDVKGYGKKFDLILGNPPYVEYSKSKIVPTVKYGNVYANVLQNSIDLLNDKGKIGFIIPISYVSTQRMWKIREYVEKNTARQKVLNFADRPSCLFVGVHQKLTILIAQKGDQPHKVYTSGYNYWYKDERNNLFNKTSLIENPFVNAIYYPKLSNKSDVNIFKKVHTNNNKGILSLKNDTIPNVFLNMRACFWIKAFSFSFESKEYKGFSFDEDKKWHIISLLNSSLFWWYWTAVSDCWHITHKELSGFYVPPKIFTSTELPKLGQLLQGKLEHTKVAIHTKQANFEYKHRLCRDLIDKIDDCISTYYKLTKTEVEYIKNFEKKYRDSLGVTNP